MIMKGEYKFHEDYWAHILEVAKDLVSKLLQVWPDQRITAEEALQNEWMVVEEETLTVKDCSLTQHEIEKSLRADKLNAPVKAVSELWRFLIPWLCCN